MKDKSYRAVKRKPRPKQNFAWVELKPGGERYFFPIESESEVEERRTELVEQAFDFANRCDFIREMTNPRFLRDIAGDLARSIPARQIVAGKLIMALLERFEKELEKAFDTDQAGALELCRPFIKVETKLRRGKTESIYAFHLPDDFEERILAVYEEHLKEHFELPRPRQRKNFWLKYADWFWVNQLVRAMDILEKRIGKQTLEEMPVDHLFDEIVAVYFRSKALTREGGKMLFWYLDDYAEMWIDAFSKPEYGLRELFALLHFPEWTEKRTEKPNAPLAVGFGLAEKLSQLIKDPPTVYTIPPRCFEELFAHILEKQGYEKVRLTPETRDGGYDIEAFKAGLSPERLLVECKRYSPERKIPVSTLRALYGVLEGEGATRAVLATTSFFSPDSTRFLSQHQWRLGGIDFTELQELLKKLRMGS